jgi:tripeptidyl-peptidase-1
LLSTLTTPTINFALSLKERNQDKVKEIALAVSTPSNPSYGQYLSAAELDQLTAPLPTSLSLVLDWLDSHNAKYVVERKRFIKVIDMPIEVAKDMLSADFTMIVREDSERRAFATRYEVPSNIVSVVDSIYGLSGVPLKKKKEKTKTNKVTSPGLPEYGPPHVNPEILKKCYNVTDNSSDNSATITNSTNKQAIVSFGGQFFSQDDLNIFYKHYVSNTTSPTVVSCVPANSCEGGSETEASLDIQYLIGMSPDVPTEGWYFDGQVLDFCGTVRAWTQTLLKAESPPLVNSVSYGFQGDLSQSGCTSAGIVGVENDLAGIAARGLSVIFASGDQGNGEDPTNKLYPCWPGSSPWVTSVGATAFIDYKLYGEEEGAHFTFASGGGFSWNMERLPNATYQDNAVNAYFKTAASCTGCHLPPSEAYHASGTGSPDVSALGQGYLVIQNGVPKPEGGTSAATPMFAGIISKINAGLIANGKKHLGFLNPWMCKYKYYFFFNTVLL